ncbi:hypothetical protein BCU11_019655 [Vibrio cyclitrophicus]|nr:hypothetical protein [Vibrio cyclitrophicus]PMJ98460.1 hypothetical protein BCU11_07580 [Vibrio cyclitrophicus]
MSLVNNEETMINALHNYKKELRDTHISNPYFSIMHDQYYELIQEVFKRLIRNGDLSRSEEFLHEVELFKQDMIKKFESSDMYSYCPRSHHERLSGIPRDGERATAVAELKKHQWDDSSDLSF